MRQLKRLLLLALLPFEIRAQQSNPPVNIVRGATTCYAISNLSIASGTLACSGDTATYTLPAGSGLSNPVTAAQGGTGIDTSGSSGVPTISSGTWSIGSSLGVARGGTALTATPSNGQTLIGNGTGYALANLTGTANQITVTNGAGTITLSGPQDLATGSSPTFANVTLSTGGALRTATADTNTLLLQARDVDGAVYTTFLTLTAGNTPTADLADSVTKAGQYIYRAGGTDVAVGDGGTGLSSWTANSFVYASATTTLASLGAAINGQIAIGSTGAAPVLATITNGGGITASSGAGTITLGSAGGTDLSGNFGAATVVGVSGVAVSAAPTTNGQALVYNGTQWAPTAITSSGSTLTVSAFDLAINLASANTWTAAQTVTRSATGGASFISNATNSSSSGSATVASYRVGSTGTTTTGANTIVGLQFNAITPVANNTFIGIYFTDADYDTILDTNSLDITGAGAITGATGITSSGTATFSGQVNVSALLLSATAPTISSGFGTSPSISANNGTAAFRVNVGTGGTASSGVIGLPTAATGWNCYCNDITTQSSTVFLCKQTAGSTTSATVGNFDAAGAAAAWVASDILAVSCFAY